MSEKTNINTFPELDAYIGYMQAIKERSKLTVKEYRYDLALFFRFYKKHKNIVPDDIEFNDIPINDIDEKILQSIDINDFYAFITFMSTERNASPSTRSRKVASLKSFFGYLKSKKRIIEEDPAAELESPKQSKRLPKHLTLEESKKLLDAAANTKHKNYSDRDYCILTLFLNCGLRLSELVDINIKDIKEDTVKVIGKGSKERTIYLNAACVDSLNSWLETRGQSQKYKNTDALFVSRLGKRISQKQVQVIVKKYLLDAGLDPKRYSVHKLRHTAATLMYKYGKVDIRSLQQILGHESIATTEIYTHIDSDQLHNAIDSNPLSDIKKNK